MRDANRWVGSGRLVRDPERKEFENNTRADFRIAINRGKDKAGKDKGAYFLNCTAWGHTGKAILDYGTKGRRLFVADASICVREYDDHGKAQYYMWLNVREVHFMDEKKRLEKNPEIERMMDGKRADGSMESDW